MAARRRAGASSTVVGVAHRAAEAEGADERLDPGADRGVADAELALHVAQVAARAEEALEEGELLAAQPAEPADAEVAFEGGPAAPAVEAGDRELAGADGTSGDDVVWHGASLY